MNIQFNYLLNWRFIMCYEIQKQTRCCREQLGHISHGKYFSKKKKIEVLETYAKELDEKASDIREYIKELDSTY